MRDSVTGGALTETTFLVLLATYEPCHGYGVMQFIERETGGRVLLGAGTLYGAINALLAKKWIAPHGEGGGSKKEYLVTAEGRQAAEAELRRLSAVRGLAEKIIGGGENEGV